MRNFVSCYRSDTVVIDGNLQQRASGAVENIVAMDICDLGMHGIVDALQARALR
jgi:hypothetical protein